MGQMCQGTGCDSGPSGTRAFVRVPFKIKVNDTVHHYFHLCTKCGFKMVTKMRKLDLRIETV